MQNNSNHTDDLQQKLLSTRYSIIDRMKNISQSIQKQKALKFINYQRYKQIQKKVISLQVLHRKSQKQVYNVQRKLSKLQQLTNYSHSLLQLKIKNQISKEKQLRNKQQLCQSIKQSNKKNLQISQYISQKRKYDRIKKIKQEDLQMHQTYLNQLRKQQSQTKRRKSIVQDNQLRIKMRLKRYQQYKIMKARQNYYNKINKEVEVSKAKALLLQQLKKKQQQQQQLFRKTQMLQSETNKIESIYLTGNCQ